MCEYSVLAIPLGAVQGVVSRLQPLIVWGSFVLWFAFDPARIGYDVMINSDEETGSHASAALIAELAKGKAAALTYEPALPDGTLAGARPGCRAGAHVRVCRRPVLHLFSPEGLWRSW